jgi:hypothetical protein
MWRGFAVVVLGILPLLGFGQNGLFNSLFLSTSPISRSEAAHRITQHIVGLRSNQPQKELKLLRKIFWSTQQEFLKTYSPHEDMDEVFTSGKYDCLTATTLYSLLLEEFQFKYSLIETNYHIFIVVHTVSSGDILLEATDRYHGFVQNKEEIEKRLEAYRRNAVPVAGSYHYSFDLYREIESNQLIGLHHFNKAVNAFNQQQWRACANELVLSESVYKSPRTKELAALLVQSVLISETTEDIKELVLRQFKAHWLEQQPIVALN